MELFKPCNYFSVAINVFSLLVRPEISKRNSEFFYHEEYKEGIVTCTVREANPKPVINWYSQELRKIDDNPKQDKWIRSNLKQSLISFPGGKYESTLTIPANQGTQLDLAPEFTNFFVIVSILFVCMVYSFLTTH